MFVTKSYLKLNKKKINVLDYADSLKKNLEAWKKVSHKDDISQIRAFIIAKKVDRLTIKSVNYSSFFNTSQPNKQCFILKIRNNSSATVTSSNYTPSYSI